MTPSAWGKAIGRARRLASPAEVAVVRENLRYLGLSAGQDPLVQQTFDAFGTFVVEFFRGLSLPPEQIARGWQVEGRDHFERLNQGERGWILAGAHTGNWEHLSSLAALYRRRIVAPTGRQFLPFLSGVVKEAKRRRAVQSVSTRHGLRELLRALDRGDLVALPLDGGSFQLGVGVHLLGRRVRLADGAARLSLLAGVPILPVFSRRTAFMEQDVFIHHPLEPAAAGPHHARSAPGGEDALPRRQVVAVMENLATLMGEHLLSCPGQWCIFRSILPGTGRVRWKAPAARPNRAEVQPTA